MIAAFCRSMSVKAGFVALAVSVLMFLFLEPVEAAISLQAPTVAEVEGPSQRFLWSDDRGQCTSGFISINDLSTGGVLLPETTTGWGDYGYDQLPADGRQLEVVVGCTINSRRNIGRYAFFSQPEPGSDTGQTSGSTTGEPSTDGNADGSTGGGNGSTGGDTGSGEASGEIVVSGQVTLAPGTVVQLAPDASVGISSGMSAEQMSAVGGSIALVFAAAYGVRLVRRALGYGT